MNPEFAKIFNDNTLMNWYFVYTYQQFLLVCNFQAAAYASEDGILTEKMIDAKVDDAIKQHTKKIDWQTEQEIKLSAEGEPEYKSMKNASTFIPPSQSPKSKKS